VGQHVTDQHRLIVIKDLGYQSEVIAANVEHRKDPLLISSSDSNAVRVWVCLPDIL